jgi:hypothetical protein
MGLRFGNTWRLMRLSDAAIEADVSYYALYQRARSAGELVRVGSGTDSVLSVSRAWLRGYVALVREQRRSAGTVEAGYLSLRQAATYLGVARATIKRALDGRGALAQYFAGINAAFGPGGIGRGTYRLNPHDVERVRVALEKHTLERRRDLVSVKALSVELGRKQQYVAQLAREANAVIVRFANGRRCYFVTPETAASIRARTTNGLPTPPLGSVPVKAIVIASGVSVSRAHNAIRDLGIGTVLCREPNTKMANAYLNAGDAERVIALLKRREAKLRTRRGRLRKRKGSAPGAHARRRKSVVTRAENSAQKERP